MKDKIVTSILIALVAIIIIYSDFSGGRVVVYDCRLSEISPDFPRSVVEECRKLKIEEDQDKVQIRNSI
jgi:hypothetical protein